MTIRDEYEKRVEEIDSFYSILNIIEFESPHIIANNITHSKNEILSINSNKVDTLRSTTYLLLYNLIESTVYNSIISIFDKINDENLKYFDVIEDLQKYWLNNLYKHDEKKRKETIIDTMMQVAIQIFNETLTLKSNEINYGGSLDARTIFATAKLMNIDVSKMNIVYEKNVHGQILVDVKKKRNWLAHGEKTFIEVGSTSVFSQLNEARIKIFEFLSEFISSVEDYISDEKYKVAILP